ncbi:pyruvate formate lyase activating enzyme like protein [Zymoseptoria brevis]|uniref:Pyruvate formate lyase activating enzyme like protein n=1 Tax=Zymoseptoria brevis TaxID=1047168 RepID=A0A0F4GNJ9_9PEZI|nr:pyruvate formate lyase activating enzyme like protein [Zymoseptoria brevis]
MLSCVARFARRTVKSSRGNTCVAQSRFKSHLAPPWLVDDYIPRYQLLTSVQESKKRASAYAHLRECNLCPRLCGVNRYEKRGTCLIGADVSVNTIAPHFGEEPCIQGHHGSGSVFFSGCNLRCVFCQNHDIAHQKNGFDLTPEQLGDWYVKLQDVGNVHNINLVTPEHVVPQVALSILHAKDRGLKVPVIYNTSSFDSLESIRLMDGLVDIYLADFKVWNPATSKRLLKADNYADAAKESIQAMHAQVGDLCFTSDGIAKKGVLVRHLVMPGLEEEGKHIVHWLAENVSKDLYIHVIEQYHPRAHVGKDRRQTRSGRAKDILSHTVEPGGSKANAIVESQIKRYQDINRAVKPEEVDGVKSVAVQCGLRVLEADEAAESSAWRL